MFDSTIFFFDLLGTFAFAVTGVWSALHKKVDFIGAIFCAVVAAVGGGIIRDTILGLPSATFAEYEYLSLAFLGAVVTYFFTGIVQKTYKIFLVMDALGLAVFALIGTQKAIEYDMPFLACITLGMITAVGGGMIRDLLIQEIPLVLRRELYAVLALLGSTIYYILFYFFPEYKTHTFIMCFFIIFIIRIFAIRYDWHLPKKR